MNTLTNIQRLMLTTAVARTDGTLMSPPVDSVGSRVRTRKATGGLTRRDLAERAPTSATIDVCELPGGAVDIVVAQDSLAAVENDERHPSVDTDEAESAGSSGPPTKTAAIISLLTSNTGATLADLVAATGWLPHTTRAALTGLRKKGYALNGTKEGKATRYHIAARMPA